MSGPQSFPWPAFGVIRQTPVWRDGAFHVGQQRLGVISYEPGGSGWTEELTGLHEAAAGQGDHPIDIASRAHAISQIARHLPPTGVVLEIGCSSGFLLHNLAASFPDATIIGSDIIAAPLEKIAARLPLPLLHFDLVRCPLPDDCIDVAVLLNVLEHIEDDSSALRQLWRILKPGGAAVFEVPAGPHLFGAYDRALMHYRRYRLGGFCQQVAAAGFEVIYRSHLGFWIYPAFLLAKRRDVGLLNAPPEEVRHMVQEDISRTRGGHLLRWALGFERAIGQVVRYPVGVRCLVTARKLGPGAPAQDAAICST